MSNSIPNPINGSANRDQTTNQQPLDGHHNGNHHANSSSSSNGAPTNMRDNRHINRSKFYEYVSVPTNFELYLREAAANLAEYSKDRHDSYQCEYCNGPHGRKKCVFRKTMREWFGKDVKIGALLALFESRC